MSENLSQNQIDDLLNMLLSGGDTDSAYQSAASDQTAGVKPYDFKTADKFPMDQRKTLASVFSTFAQILSNQITGILRTNCECKVCVIEENTFNEINNSLPDPVILVIMSMEPLEGSQIIILSAESAYMIVSRLLGGVGGNKNADVSKQFTDIEKALIEQLFKQIIHVFDDAWEKVFPAKAKFERLETSSQFAQIVALQETLVIITMELTIGGETGLMYIGIPHSSIEPVSKKLNTRVWFSGIAKDKSSGIVTEQIARKLERTPVTLSAYFADTQATVREVMSWQVGDLVVLDHKMTEPLTVKVQHIPKFLAEIGTQNNKIAVQLVGTIKEETGDEPLAGRN